MRKFVFLMVVSLVALVSCNKDKNRPVEPNLESVPNVEAAEKRALEVAGIYNGILPCADCQGIQTSIGINADYTYEITSLYLGTTGNAEEFIEQGTWAIQGDVIKLYDQTQDELVKQVKIEDSALKYLDLEGQEIKGSLAEHYILKKQ